MTTKCFKFKTLKHIEKIIGILLITKVLDVVLFHVKKLHDLIDGKNINKVATNK
jgi:hypothetical protein